MTQGALMAFENDHGLTADGVAGPAVWKALISRVLAGKRSTLRLHVRDRSARARRRRSTLWHNGKTVISGAAVNTGIASAPTATGTYPGVRAPAGRRR